jgi:hypothetical protein
MCYVNGKVTNHKSAKFVKMDLIYFDFGTVYMKIQEFHYQDTKLSFQWHIAWSDSTVVDILMVKINHFHFQQINGKT